jgi:hypothetical protein
MASLTLNLKSSDNKFRYDFTNEFYEKNYEVAVTKLHGIAKFFYTFEYMKYDKKNDEDTPESFEIEIDNNEFSNFDELVEAIMGELKNNDHSVFEFEIDDDDIVTITNKNPKLYHIDFTSKNSIGKMLGFENTILDNEINIAKHEFNVPNKTFFISTNVIENSYFNDKRRDILYSFTTTEQGYVYLVNTPIYLKTIRKIKDLMISIVDINNNKLDFEKCDLLINLHLRPITY